MQCALCDHNFANICDYADHLKSHYACQLNGRLPCPCCLKQFHDVRKFTKHLRRSHFDKRHICSDCGKAFISPHKLKLHVLCHSQFAEFLCSLCGRNYKRRDKLRDHLKRMHSLQREEKSRSAPVKSHRTKRFRFPKMSSEEVSKYAFQCMECVIGFNRRGVLINHLSRVHPEVPLDSVPQVSAPILQQQLSFKCQYCNRVYMSNGKRKSHIINSHPGAEIIGRLYNIKDAGCIEVKPRSCNLCSRQFLTNAKLLQHQRKYHPLYNAAEQTSGGTNVLPHSQY